MAVIVHLTRPHSRSAPALRRRTLSDAEIVRLARQVLADPDAWADADLDPAQLRDAQTRALALLDESLCTI